MAEINLVADLNQAILGEVSKVVVGKEQIKEMLLVALIAGGMC